MTTYTTIRPVSALLLAALLVGGCRAEFEPDLTGPGTPVPPPPPPAVIPNIPFKLGAFGPDFATGVVVDGLGNATVTGYFSGTVDFDPGSGATARTAIGPADGMVAKYRDDGSFVWVFAFGGTGVDLPADIAATPDGGAVITGTISSGASCGGRTTLTLGTRDAFLAKISAGGACEWLIAIGGPGESEDARDVLVEPNGDILVIGGFVGTVDFDQSMGTSLLTSRGGGDVFVARYGDDGAFKGVTQFGGAGEEVGTTLARSSSGDVIVGGEFTGSASFGAGSTPIVLVSAGETDFFLAGLAPSLSLQWAVRGGGTGSEYLTRNGLLFEPGGTLVLAGQFSGTADLDGGPGTAIVISQGGSDIFVTRFGPTGQAVGSPYRIGGIGNDGVQALAVDGEGNFYLSGWFSGSVDFDPSSGTTIRNALGAAGASDAYIASLTGVGTLRWVSTVGGAAGGDGSTSIGAGLAVTGDGALWSVGRFFGLVDLDPGTEAVNVLSAGDADQFVLRLERASGLLRR